MGEQPATAPHAGPDDASLVAAARAGDGAAFGELYRRHNRAVSTAARQWIDDPEQRRDVVQESFVRALQKLDSLSEPARFRAWVLQITRNAAIDELRKRRNFNPTSIELELDLPPDDSADAPDVVAEVGDLARQIGAGLAQLSERDATAVALAAHLGMGPAEIGTALGVTPNNAKVILHRARRRLRAAVELEAR